MNLGNQHFRYEKKESRTFQFKGLLQKSGWISPAYVRVDSDGIIRDISIKPAKETIHVEKVNGFALPGFQNAHSHAFQYAMAGMAEKHKPNTLDDFWTWREAMYGCALTMDPDQMQSVATMLYAEMLKRGYTHVAEFHYLHHDKSGKPFTNISEMGVSLIAAAAIAGIKITLVPVFYQKGGFGLPAEPQQRRFIFEAVDPYFQMLDDCASVVKNLTTARLGFGVHSLRAADSSEILRVINEGPKEIPFHMHVAEQIKEVNDAVSFLKQRPVEWILDNMPVNDRFHFIHCTHLTDNEVLQLARSNAHVVLCPGTEANLGDGIFRLADFAKYSDKWCIGTDSQISLNPCEDLRWLDYAQRLTTHKRNTFPDAASVLVRNAYFSGHEAMGLKTKNYFEIGEPLDAVVYDGDSPLLNSAGFEHLLQTIVYTSDSSALIGTMVNGTWIIKDRHHRNEREIAANFHQTLKNISEEL